MSLTGWYLREQHQYESSSFVFLSIGYVKRMSPSQLVTLRTEFQNGGGSQSNENAASNLRTEFQNQDHNTLLMPSDSFESRISRSFSKTGAEDCALRNTFLTNFHLQMTLKTHKLL
ncbi:Uncharacterized protein Fot_13925 [Forsythia ovata]|uniref:Uncharacterized protein n=1 Tax=Forsythia ovata TaxID=205694 RepID=A0ABD1W4V8_9LAMI